MKLIWIGNKANYMNKYVFTVLLLIISGAIHSQTIVNTEKLFQDDDDGIAFGSELIGSSIQGNAELFLLEYSLNLRYKKKKSSTKLFTGGEYVYEDGEVISNSVFGQLRYSYHINDKSRLFSFYQLQQNKILLLNSRQLLGVGYRRNLFQLGTDSTTQLKFDYSIGVMQEEEKLNEIELGVNDRVYSNYTRGIISTIVNLQLGKGISIINSTYYQARFKDLMDYRILNETNFIFSIKKWLAISLDVDYRYDSAPPSVLKNSDLNTNMGFLITL